MEREGPEISQETRQLIGIEKVRHYQVTARDIWRFAQAIGMSQVEADSDGTLIGPPLICQVFMFEDLALEELPADGSPKELDVPVPAARAVGGQSEFEIFAQVKAGDTITFRSRLRDVAAKQGRSGWLYFIVVETAFENQRGEMVARETATYVKRSEVDSHVER